jgi:outer membrane receptor protein involved in Fe transport
MTTKTIAAYWARASAPGMLVLLFVLVLAFSGAVAQTTTGTIVGTVSDSSGAALAGVTITVINEGTTVQRSVSTGSQGEYTVPLLPIGNYTVKAEHTSFKITTVTGVRVDVQQTVRTDIAMHVGSTVESVNVTSEVPLLKTDASDVGAVINETQVVELPLNGRSFLQLATLVPGTISVQNGANQTDGVLPVFGGGIQTNGADTNGNLIMLDGIENQDWLIPRVGLVVSPDAIAEFKVMTSNYSAEYGRAAGAVVNVATKSGSNSFHGNVYEFLRNNDLDARNYFATTANPPLQQNQFGATFGGPIVKNKTFFFVNYDGFRQNNGLTVNAIMPTTAQRAGDLSSGAPIFDPLTTQTNPITGAVTRSPFPGNIIPTDRLSPQAQTALSLLYPEPQQNIANTYNAIYHPVGTDNYNQGIARIDQNIGEKNVIWGRFGQNHNPTLEPIDNSSGLPGQGTVLQLEQVNVVLGYTRTFSANMVNDFRVGYNRYYQGLGLQSTMNYVGDIGINGAIDDPVTWGPPNINVTGITSVGAFQYAPSHPVTNEFEYLDTLSFVHGAHALKVGADIRRAQLNGKQYTNSRGVYGFGGKFTNDPTNQASTGQGLADFLLGYPTTTSVTLGAVNNDLRAINGGFFVQDNWNITKNLTLNLGLRYDYLPQPISARDRFSDWDPKTHTVVTALTDLNAIPYCAGCGTQTLGELENAFAGTFQFSTRAQAGLNRALVNNDYNGWAPRVGAAWRLNSRTVLRGGWGRFFEVVAGNVAWNMNQGQPPYSRALSFAGNTLAQPTFTFQNPFPSTGVQGAPGTGVQLQQYRNPRNNSWNIVFQRQVRDGMTFDFGYVGTIANNQPLYADFNSTEFGIASTQLLRPDPTIGSTSVDTTWGHSWYDSLQARYVVQLKTLNLSANYTWGHAITVGGGGINQNDAAARLNWNFFGFRPPVLSGNLSPNDIYLSIDKGPAVADIRHIFVSSFVWDLPFGKGRLVNLSGPADWVAGGWEFTGVTSLQSGFPNPISCQFSCPRPNLLGNPNAGAPHTVNEWFNTSPGLYQTPPSTLQAYTEGLNPIVTIGTAGREPILGPGIDSWDLGIYKNFPFRESYSFQFRAEMFNAFNHPVFGPPNTSYGNPSFGRITSAAPGREVQLAGKFYF